MSVDPLKDLEGTSLRELGFRMPAEWEPHKATWLAWPHQPETWGPKAEIVPHIWARMAREIVEGEDVHILVNDEDMQAWAMRILKENKADASNVFFHLIETNDAWMRDFGPTFVKSDEREPSIVAIDWIYNCWGEKYPPFDQDQRAAQRIAEEIKVPVVEAGFVAEGGAIEVNGKGTVLTTEQCLINPNRNPTLSREDVDARLRDFLGVSTIHWLTGGIEGDDTDSHIDEIARFLDAKTIAVTTDPNKTDRHHELLAENLERLKDMRDQDGRPFDIIEFPIPDPVIFDGVRLPAAYCNFYITNACVLVPSFDCKKTDERAAGIIKDFFPHRRIAQIRASDVIWGLGAFHCVTQQQPL